MTRDGLTAKDIARLDEREYEEPGRDLLASKPDEPGEGEGARGDVPNPVAGDGIPGSIGHTERKLGSDEHDRLAKGKRS